MNILKLYKNRQIFLTFFVSYIGVIVFTVIIGSISYFTTLSTVRQSVEEYNKAMLQQAKIVIDDKTQTVERAAVDLALNSYVSTLANRTSVNNSEDLYTISKLISEIKARKDTNDFIKGIYIYLSNSDTIINNEGKFNSEFFFKEIVPYKNLNYEKWKEFYSKDPFRGYRPVQQLDFKSYQSDIITFQQPIGSYRVGTSIGSVVVMIDKEDIDSVLKSISLHGSGSVYVFNAKNELMFGIGNKNYLSYIDKSRLETSDSYQKDGKDGKVVVSSEKSIKNGWRYVSVIPMSIYYEKSAFVKKIVLFITLSQLCLGVIIALLLSKRTYAPIRKTYDKIKELIGYKGELQDCDYFNFIEETTLSTLRENTSIKESVSKLEPILRNDLINQLIKNADIENDDIKQKLTNIGIEFKTNQFSVLKIYIDDCSKFIQNTSLQEMALVKLIITNVIGELSNENFDIYSVDYDTENIVLIVNTKTEYSVGATEELGDKESHNKLVYNNFTQILFDSQKIIGDRFSVFISIGISSFYDGIQAISQCFLEAEKALNYKMIKGFSSIIKYEDIEHVTPIYAYNLQKELQLINCIKIGDMDKVTQILEEVYNDNFGSMKQSLEMAYCLFFDMISTAIKVMDEFHITQIEVFKDTNPLDKLFKCETIDEMYQRLLEIYKSLCNYINDNKKSHNEELKDKILNFISIHFTENSLSLVSVSDSIELNSTYLSYFFKEQVGETFINYIGRLRSNKAKELLRDTDWSLQEIAEKIGYANSGVFIRAFKRYEGSTPGKYRDSVEKN